jgi:hypothetical protein
MKRTQTTVLLATAALTGLLMGTSHRASAATLPGSPLGSQHQTVKASTAGVRAAVGLDDSTTQPAHACKGQNACKGQGGCKTGDQGCKGKNSCKGNGGCKTTSI